MFKKLRSLCFFVTEGIKNIWINRLMSLASFFVMICCLVLTGISFLFSENIKLALKNIEGRNSITIYLKTSIDVDLEEIKNKILSIENVNFCNIYPKNEAMREYEGLLGEKVTNLFKEEGNPFPDAFKVGMNDLTKYKQTVEKIKEIYEVDSISDRSDTAKKLTDLRKFVRMVGIWIILGLSAVSLLIISNTIRITFHSRRLEISIMKSIGATNMFVRMPFIVEGIIIGLTSGLFSIFILNLIYDLVIKTIKNIAPFNAIPFNMFLSKFLLSFGGAGILFGLLGGIISIKKYLRKEGAEIVSW